MPDRESLSAYTEESHLKTPRWCELVSLAAMYDHAAEEEQVLMMEGDPRAEAEHQRARILLRAWQAEQDDPEPMDMLPK